MIQPFKAGDTLADHARPIAEVMVQLKGALTEFANLKSAKPDFASRKADNLVYKGHAIEVQEDEMA